MRDNILYTAGYPRSGTWWITRLLSDLLDSPIYTLPPDNVRVDDFYQTGEGGYVIYKTHWKVSNWIDNGRPGKVVFIQRDPRDVAVSAMYYEELENTADNLMDVIKLMVLENPNVDFLTYHEPGAYERYVRDWLDEKDAIKTKYECLYHADTELCNIVSPIIQDMVTVMGMDIANACDRQRFENWQHKYPHAMRKGISGDWVNHFNREHGEFITEHLGALMLEMGYIDSLDWWTEL